MSETRIRGRIKSIKNNYGFIGGIDRTDYFFHWGFLNEKTKTFKMLNVGDTVEFRPEIQEDKPRAMDIVVID